MMSINTTIIYGIEIPAQRRCWAAFWGATNLHIKFIYVYNHIIYELLLFTTFFLAKNTHPNNVIGAWGKGEGRSVDAIRKKGEEIR